MYRLWLFSCFVLVWCGLSSLLRLKSFTKSLKIQHHSKVYPQEDVNVCEILDPL